MSGCTRRGKRRKLCSDPLLDDALRIVIEQCPFSGLHRKTFAQAEFFSV
jgi:hypothetical protein